MTTEDKLLKLRKLADAMYYAAQYLTTDASRLHKAMDEYHQFIIHEYHKKESTIPDIVDEHWWEMLGEETVSEDLEEAAKERVDAEDYCCVDEDGMPLYDSDYLEYMFKEGAQWQKEQMMKKAVEVRIRYINSDICAFSKEFTKYMDGVRGGSKVKLIIIKED